MAEIKHKIAKYENWRGDRPVTREIIDHPGCVTSREIIPVIIIEETQEGKIVGIKVSSKSKINKDKNHDKR